MPTPLHDRRQSQSQKRRPLSRVDCLGLRDVATPRQARSTVGQDRVVDLDGAAVDMIRRGNIAAVLRGRGRCGVILCRVTGRVSGTTRHERESSPPVDGIGMCFWSRWRQHVAERKKEAV